MRKDILPYYRVLGLSPGAGPNEIRRAYRQLVQQWHPDLFRPGSPMQTTAEDMTKEINEAYGQLFRKKLYRHYPPAGEQKDEGVRAAMDTAGRRTGGESPASRPVEPKGSRWARLRRCWKTVRGRAALRWYAAALGLAVLAACAWAWWPNFSPARGIAAVAVRTTEPPTVRDRPAPTAGGDAPEQKALAVVPAPGAATTRELAALEQGLTGLRMGFHAPEPEAGMAAIGPLADDLADKLALADKLIEELFEPGDTKARVKAVQGVPDEEGSSVLRYGSSLVYFRDGRVRGWVNREPRLRVPWWDDTVMPTVERFSTGSSRAEVVRAQGQPGAFSTDLYLYGTSAVRFSGGRVSGWEIGDVPLRAFDLPALPPQHTPP